MKHRIVIFSDKGARIVEGANPADYLGRKDVLINPTYPPGVPPHLWKLHPDGHIETVSTESKFPASKFSAYLPYLLAISLTLNLALSIYLLCCH